MDHPCHVALEDDAKRCTESTLRFIPGRVWHCLDSHRCSGSEHAAVNAARYSFQGFPVVDRHGFFGYAESYHFVVFGSKQAPVSILDPSAKNAAESYRS